MGCGRGIGRGVDNRPPLGCRKEKGTSKDTAGLGAVFYVQLVGAEFALTKHAHALMVFKSEWLNSFLTIWQRMAMNNALHHL